MRIFGSSTVLFQLMAVHVTVKSANRSNVAVELLKNGRVIAVPTDTVYGLACDATNPEAIAKLYSIKRRNELKPVAICLGNVNFVQLWAKVNHLPKGLLEALFPGPVTLILTCAKKLDKSLSFDGKIGIRIPDSNFIRTICNELNRPLALTSANLSNEPSCVNIHEFSNLWNKISAVFDGGDLSENNNSSKSASTVVDLATPNRFYIIRQGIALTHTVNILNQFGLKSASNFSV